MTERLQLRSGGGEVEIALLQLFEDVVNGV